MEARLPTISKQPSSHQVRKKISGSKLRLVSHEDSIGSAAAGSFYDVAVIGLGYVGLPLCLAFAKANISVLGVDTDSSKAENITSGKSYIKHIPSCDIEAAIENKRFSATDNFSELTNAESILICVPTPLTINRTPDLSYVESTAKAIAPHLREGQLVVLESTTYPGTTDEVVRPILEEGSGLKAGDDFYLAYSPEREDPGNPNSNFADCPKVVGGSSALCLERATSLYKKIVQHVVPAENCRVAEATKLTENIFRSVNIALVNELKIIFSSMGIDVWKVINAASTKPYGFMPFYPGPGLGGHCIPIDPFYLTWKALEYGQRTRLIELAGEINTAMPLYVVHRITEALNDASKSIRGSKILLLGLAYKANVDDCRESPTYEIMKLLEDRGAEVAYNDPHVPVIVPGRSHHSVAGRKSQSITNGYDVIALCTAHEVYRTFDFESLDVPFVDCRNFAEKIPAKNYAA